MPQSRVESIIEALPYFRKYVGKTIVVKYGGSAQIDASLRTAVCEDLVLMQTLGIRTVLIHGGGPEISDTMKKFGKTPKFIEGLRVTDEETAEIAEMVLVGKINKGIVAEINLKGGTALGLSGRDGNLILSEKVKPIDVDGTAVDLGLVGAPKKINTEILRSLLQSGYMPVIAPTGMAPDGKMLNINGDTVAGHIAGAVAAEKLIFLTDQKGILRDVKNPDSVISVIKRGEIDFMKKEGILAGGMLPKIDAAMLALQSDVEAVHVIDGRVNHSLILELFTSSGVGTMIVKH